MSSEKLGVVCVKQYVTDNGPRTVMKKHYPVLSACPLPLVLEPNESDPSREWYLYDEIKLSCHHDTSACPKPIIPKSDTDIQNKA